MSVRERLVSSRVRLVLFYIYFASENSKRSLKTMWKIEGEDDRGNTRKPVLNTRKPVLKTRKPVLKTHGRPATRPRASPQPLSLWKAIFTVAFSRMDRQLRKRRLSGPRHVTF